MNDPVRIHFDWHYQLNGTVLFQLLVERRGIQSCIDFLIDIRAIDQTRIEKLSTFLTRYHNHETSSPEVVQTVKWLLDMAMIQQGASEQERQAAIKKLLLSDSQQQDAWELPPLSPEQALFELLGQKDLIETGNAAFFEESKAKEHYLEIQPVWQKAAEAFDFGTPRLEAFSPLLQRQFKWFFLELGYGDSALAFSKHSSLLQAHSHNQAFRRAVADILKNPPIPHKVERSLPFNLLRGWMHSFFWGLTNTDRIELLHRVYGVSEPISDKTIRRAVTKLGLKDWSDFRQTYPASPFVAKLYCESGQEMCQFRLRTPGHFQKEK